MLYSLARPTMVSNASSIMSSNLSFHYSVTSINSRKSRKNVLYPRRAHPPPVTVLPSGLVSPKWTGSPDYSAQTLTWEVRYICATLLPHSETRLLPAGTVLLRSLGQAKDLSLYKNEEIHHCSIIFLVLTREVLLKDAVGVEELEGPSKLLHLTLRDILFEGASDSPTTWDPNDTGLQTPRTETEGPERFTGVLRALASVMDAFEAALNTINPPAVIDEALQEHYHQVSLKFSVVKDLTMDQHRKVLGQKLAQARSLQGAPHAIPPTIEEGSEAEDQGSSAENSSSRGRSTLIIGKRSFPRRLLSRLSPLPWVQARTLTPSSRFHMHPLFSHTRLHHAPISYDIAFTPSARTVVDRTIHVPVPALTLARPATEPTTLASSRLVLRSPKLPWTVAVGPISSPPSFFIGRSVRQRNVTTSTLTNLDVLYAVHTTLMTRVTPEEWAALGEGSRAQRRVAEAYKQRCTRMGGGWEGGVRRVDWLGSKTHLVGIEIDKSNEAGENVGKLVFAKA